MFILRPLKQSDAVSLQAHADNFNIWLNVRDAFPHPYMLIHAEEFIRQHSNAEPVQVWGIEINEQICGCIGYHPLEDVYRRSAEIGYWLSEDYWGQGIMTKATLQAVERIFTTSSCNRLFAGVFSSNPASMRVLEKAGFRFEGTGIQAVIKAGKVLNEHRYALLRDEFFQHKNKTYER